MTPKYLGGDMVLLMGLTDTRAEEMCREGAANGTTLFYSLEKWQSSMRTRLLIFDDWTRLRC